MVQRSNSYLSARFWWFSKAMSHQKPLLRHQCLKTWTLCLYQSTQRRKLVVSELEKPEIWRIGIVRLEWSPMSQVRQNCCREINSSCQNCWTFFFSTDVLECKYRFWWFLLPKGYIEPGLHLWVSCFTRSFWILETKDADGICILTDFGEWKEKLSRNWCPYCTWFVH